MKIERLEIFAPDVKEQLRFYEQSLELEINNVTETSFEVVVGYSVLKVQHSAQATPYHIAFHIPANQEKKALQWLKQRVDILKNEGEELVDFTSWNAKSMYFHDAGKNVLEFISRGHCFPSEAEEFTSQNIIGISEIGVATNDVREKFDFLHQHFDLSKFTGDYERFCATGDDEGLFIVIDRNKKVWFPTNEKAFASEFRICFSGASKPGDLTYKNERLSFT